MFGSMWVWHDNYFTALCVHMLLMCSPVCSSTVIGCTYDLPSGIYNMYVYDIEEEDILSDDWLSYIINLFYLQ